MIPGFFFLEEIYPVPRQARTFILNHLTGSVTIRTCLNITVPYQTWTAGCKQSDPGLYISDKSPVMFPVSLRFRDMWYIIFENDFQLFLASENRFLKSNVHTCTKVGTLHRSIVGPSGSASAAEQISEDISEDVSHIRTVEVESAKAAGTASPPPFSNAA